jgi:diguanylate cyclase (GGDEF)-like protein
MHELPVLFFISILSQVTFTITLTVLAWRSRHWHRMIWLVSACCLPLLLNGALSVFEQTYTERTALRWSAVGAMTVMLFSFLVLYLASRNRPMARESYFDRLTGLHNRTAMKLIAAREVAAAKSAQAPLALLLIEIDNFTQFQSALGEAVCDRALRAVSGILQTVGSAQDRVARLRSEEFGVLLPGKSTIEVNNIAERLRNTIQSLQFQVEDQNILLTVSIGVGFLREGEANWAQMLSRADVALMCGKRSGSNRVVMDIAPVEHIATARHDQISAADRRALPQIA